MLKQLLSFEIFYHIKQRSTLVFLCIFLLTGFVMSSSGMAANNVNFNAPYELLYLTTLLSINALFMIMFMVIVGTCRDNQYHTESSIFCQPVPKHVFFLSRFLGSFMICLAVFSAFLPGFFMGTFWPSLDASRIGDFNPNHYLFVLTWIVIPNVLVLTSLVFSISILIRKRMVAYVSAVGIYTLYVVASAFFDSPILHGAMPDAPINQLLASLMDPFGLIAILDQTQLWEAHEKNALMIEISGYFLWNRICWVGFSVVLLILTYKQFSFRKMSTTKRKGQDQAQEGSMNKMDYRPVAVFFGLKGTFQHLMSLIKLQMILVFKSLPFIVLMLLWIIAMLPVLQSKLNGGGIYGESYLPDTHLLIGLFKDNMILFSFLLITIYSGELVWKERSHNMVSLVSSSPISNLTLFFSKLIPLLLIPVFIIATGILVAVVFQLLNGTLTGYHLIDFGLYASLFYYYGVGLFCYAILALFIQGLINNKFIGMGVSALIYLFFVLTPMSIVAGLEHPMLQMGRLPIPQYSQMTGYQGQTKFHLHALYWVGFFSILVIMASKFWARRVEDSLKLRLQQLRTWSGKEGLAMALASMVFMASGCVVFYQTNIKDTYKGQEDELNRKEYYERNFSQYKDFPRLDYAEMKTKVDLYPSEGRYDVRAEYLLKNYNEVVVDQLLITEREQLGEIHIEHASLTSYDSIAGTYLFYFNEPVEPNATVKLHYSMAKQASIFTLEKNIVKNGTYINRERSFEPRLGYSEGLEIKDAYERQKRKLPPKADEYVIPGHLSSSNSKGTKVKFETILSTEKDQIAISIGSLINQWQENGRNYYHYKSMDVVAPEGVYMSAHYDSLVTQHHGTRIEQYFDPAHQSSAKAIAAATQQTFDYCNKNFGKYPYDHFRIAEIPGHWDFQGASHSGLITFTDDGLYLLDHRDKGEGSLDLLAKRVVHEVSHQWWGGMLSPKFVEGGTLLTEGLAKYTELVILEKLYGPQVKWQLSKTANEMYFGGRAYATEPEVPLYLSKGQSYLSYGKNLAAMLALKDLIGEDKVNEVLRMMIDTSHLNDSIRYISIDFLNMVQAHAPDKHARLIDDWFKKVITYDLSVDEVKVERLEDRKFKVSIAIQAKRFELREDGVRKDIDINEPIQIGLFTKHPKYANQESIIFLNPLIINQEKQVIEVVVDELPRFVSIDPYGSRSDKNLSDNVKGIEVDML